MGAEERSRAFSEAQVDAQLVYIEAERDLIAEHQLVVQLESDNSSLQSENDALRELARGAVPIVDGREDDAGMRSRWLEQARRAMDGEAS